MGNECNNGMTTAHENHTEMQYADDKSQASSEILQDRREDPTLRVLRIDVANKNYHGKIKYDEEDFNPAVTIEEPTYVIVKNGEGISQTTPENLEANIFKKKSIHSTANQ